MLTLFGIGLGDSLLQLWTLRAPAAVFMWTRPCLSLRPPCFLATLRLVHGQQQLYYDHRLLLQLHHHYHPDVVERRLPAKWLDSRRRCEDFDADTAANRNPGHDPWVSWRRCRRWVYCRLVASCYVKREIGRGSGLRRGF